MGMEIKKMAQLARIHLTPEEESELQGQLSQVLSYFDSLKELDTSQITPLFHPTEVEGLLRDDKMKKSKVSEKILEQAPECMGSLFKVPPVV